ncbi:MAG: ZIP family metal transporter [Thermoanaerobacteraceae bacterium]|nr:ZIP family metal transporter [Thermoanaerobacteraceae bacterium]
MIGLAFLSGAGTLLGAALALCFPIRRVMATLIGFAAGVMSGVILLELVPTALKLGGLTVMLSGILAGSTLLFLTDHLLRHPADATASYQRLGWLLFTGIALHDLPEGMAIGTGGALTTELGIFLAAALGMHNLPEGLVNALPLRLGGLTPGKVLGLNALLSLVTPAGTFIGLGMAHWKPRLIPFLLAVAAGAMTYIVLKELAPRTLKEKGAIGFVLGVLTILLLLRLVEA